MPDKLDLIEKLKSDQKFSSFAKAITVAGLEESLKEQGPFTILAPTNSAFEKVPEATMTDLVKPENKSRLAELLNYHIIAGQLKSVEIARLTTAKTLQGQEIKIDATKGIRVNDSEMQARNMNATNGIIHAIDTVLVVTAAAKMS